MTTYFFPFGTVNPTATSASFTSLAITASFTSSIGSIHGTASYSKNTPIKFVSGSQGPTATAGDCVALIAPSGSSGSTGPTGPQGPNLTTCPAGTILCPYLTAPSGYSIVCMQTITSCNPGATIICPDLLP